MSPTMSNKAPDQKILDPELPGTSMEKLHNDLARLVIGQPEAIKQVVELFQIWSAGLSDARRPIGNLLFLGPTGTGKTRLVEALAQVVLGNDRAVLKIDCAEFQHSHEIAKLIGSPAGYLGHRETQPLLSPEAVSKYHTDSIKISFVLFDEIEKASNALWNLLLGILDKATLTLGDTRKVDFSKCMIFMTSNLGAADMARVLSPGLGFAPVVNTGAEERIKLAGLSGAKRNFTPEFMNRLDKVVVFNTLSESDMNHILTLELEAVQQRIFMSQSTQPFVIQVTDPARKFILKLGIDDKYGARYLKRTIERLLVNSLANLITSNQLNGGDLVEVGLDIAGGKLTFCRKEENLPASRMVNEIAERASAVAGGDLSGRGNSVPEQSVPAEPKRAVIPFVKRVSPQRTARKRTRIQS